MNNNKQYLRSILVISSNFQKIQRVPKTIWRIINSTASISRENIVSYLSEDIVRSLRLTVFLEL